MVTFALTLKHEIEILQSDSAARDSAGQPVHSWKQLRKQWADVRTTGGLESIRAGAVTSTINSSIRVRFRPDLSPSLRVSHRGIVYDILAVLPSADRVYADLVCRSVA